MNQELKLVKMIVRYVFAAILFVRWAKEPNEGQAGQRATEALAHVDIFDHVLDGCNAGVDAINKVGETLK